MAAEIKVPIKLEEWPYSRLEEPLRERLRLLMQEVGTTNSISLDRLEGVSVVEDLTKALETFDAGYPSDRAAAMRDTVMGRMIMTKRGDRVQAHIFFPVDAALQIADQDAPHHRQCAYMFAHECAHVQDLDTRAKSLNTNELLNPPVAQPISLSIQIAWNEYAACRLSAFCDPNQSEDFKELLRQSTQSLIELADEPRAAFAAAPEARAHALTIALDLVLPVLQAFSYLLGHCRGTSSTFSDWVPENYVALITSPQTAAAFSNVERELDLLWQTRDCWQNHSAFHDLADAICYLIAVLTGIVMKPESNGQLAVALVAKS